MLKIKIHQKNPYVTANTNRFSGFAKNYDRFRPSVPKEIVKILTQLAHVTKARRVVDIGCGTGLSTRIWAKYADEVVGIEPNDDMRHQAELHSDNSNIHYQKGLSISTGLPNNFADILTIVEAFHWMEPINTLKEISRVLRPGGVFAAIDYDWTPTINPKAEKLDLAFEDNAKKLLNERGYDKAARRWPKKEHIFQIEKSGLFKSIKEIIVSGKEIGDYNRMIGLAINQSNIQILFKKGISEEKIGLPIFRKKMKCLLGEELHPMYFTFHIRLGIKPQ